MADLEEARRIVSRMDGASISPDGLAFSITKRGKEKGFAWVWAERVDPKKARVKNPLVLAVRVPGLTAKDLLIASDPEKFFTEPHYNGFPAVLVRLAAVEAEELEDLLAEAKRCMVEAR